ncbi:FadR/GntR family transcriptional regulator [Thermoactinomyces mirandus]|uniref:FadR family transcriptional regulator n=1 Tax=Thermoactinomyces mirandus TaxID=2756294 RepID=A0A7W1XS57_9BACL|nr:FadR/GntR family transcriptional regulator [Thermoactinomyces mirandus]MBA4602145.1 FadR family transcriptional regulator [Thermoactinomyces mirandus]
MKAIPQFKVRKTYDEVADYLKEQIMNGTYKPGDRLPSLRELSELLGVGQSTIREAVSSLKTMGLVTIRHGEGTFVTRFDPEEIMSGFEQIQPVTKQDILSLLEARKIIETGIARLAAERRSKEKLKNIEEALKEMEQAVAKEELGDKADLKFHYEIARASHNPVLEFIMQSISETMGKALKASREKMFQTKGYPEQLLAEHRNIFEAIAGKNPKKAEEAMLNHLLGVERELFD